MNEFENWLNEQDDFIVSNVDRFVGRKFLELCFLSGVKAALEQQWQPIETYDVYKHPENVLLLCTTLERTNHKTTAPFIIEGWLDKDNEWQCDLTWTLDGLKPTHWQPLPQPPKGKS